MSLLAIKIAFGSSLITGPILGIYGIHRYIESIGIVSVGQSLTSSEKERILSTTISKDTNISSYDYQDWKIIFKDSSTLEKLKKFISLDNDINENDAIRKLKEKCQESKEIFSNKSEFPEIFSNFKKFCLKRIKN